MHLIPGLKLLLAIYTDSAHRLNCSYRFNCGTNQCPESVDVSKKPPCHTEKFKRYQPEGKIVLYRRDWEEINQITWRDVFTLQESWIYTLIIIIVAAFLFMAMILVKLLINVN
ncbi:MAG: hypothetical protein IBX39_05260 [Candidatus Methanoperedenaceae archaeon]|nr:hypothetical protein [Candidatus Methanoperedenaceae archaeon]